MKKIIYFFSLTFALMLLFSSCDIYVNTEPESKNFSLRITNSISSNYRIDYVVLQPSGYSDVRTTWGGKPLYDILNSYETISYGYSRTFNNLEVGRYDIYIWAYCYSDGRTYQATGEKNKYCNKDMLYTWSVYYSDLLWEYINFDVQSLSKE